MCTKGDKAIRNLLPERKRKEGRKEGGEGGRKEGMKEGRKKERKEERKEKVNLDLSLTPYTKINSK